MARRQATVSERTRIEETYGLWLGTIFGDYITGPAGQPISFAPHHHDFWRWVWAIDQLDKPQPFVGVWPRGGAKSTSVEMATVALGGRRRRRYVWYVSEIQPQADDHVGNIASMLESAEVATFYPDLAERSVGKYGSSRGWRRNRLRTRAGFTVDALGLDTAVRGVKLEDDRPDLIVFDDVDDGDDTVGTVEKKLSRIRTKILPAGSTNLGVIFIQNLIHPGSIACGLVGYGDTAPEVDMLVDRIVSGPIPAIRDVEYEWDAGYKIVGGQAVWDGQDLAACQAAIDTWGYTAFESEAQHKIRARKGEMFSHLDFETMRISEIDVPTLKRKVCWVDPAITETDKSDSHAIQIDGLGTDGKIYRLYSWEQRTTPLKALKKAIRLCIEYDIGAVGVETDQGGLTWESVFREARALIVTQLLQADLKGAADRAQRVGFKGEKAGRMKHSKIERAARMLVDYEADNIRHVEGTHPALDDALFRFPRTAPLDLVDAAFWSWWDLREGGVVAASVHDEWEGNPYAAERKSLLRQLVGR